LFILAIIIYKFHFKCPCKKTKSHEDNEDLEIQDIKKNDENNYMVEKPYYLLDNQNK